MAKRKKNRRSPSKKKRRSSQKRRQTPAYETLEARQLLATLVVNSTLDNFDANAPATDGVVTLREAILAANSDMAVGDAQAGSGSDTITFDANVFSGDANSLIRLGGTELVITESLTIDGSSATDVVISGDKLGNDTPVDGTFVTDVDASLAANAGLLDDNSRVINVSAAGGNFTFKGLTITGGRTTVAEEEGGGLRVGSGLLTLEQSTVSGNSTAGASAHGGGIYKGFGVLRLRSSTISGNRSQADGGGIFNDIANIFIEDSTVTGNVAGGAGGGVYLAASDQLLTLSNSIFAGNLDNGTAPDLRTAPGPTFNVNFVLIGDTTGSGITAGTGTGNLLNVDAQLGPLADNGGSNPTHRLLPSSPAVDAGNSSFATDQRGFTRPLDFATIPNANGSNGADMGAFEVQPAPAGLVVTTNQDVVDSSDPVNSLREAINFANAQAGADTITFDPLVFTGGAASLLRLKSGQLGVTDALTIDGSTGTGVVISGDATGNDTLVTGTFITDVEASLAADPTSLNDNSRVFNFSAASGDLTLNSLTLTGGRTSLAGDNGGGVRMNGNGTLAINNSTVSGNSTSNTTSIGGGIWSDTAAITISSSTISGNSAPFGGGGIASTRGAITLTSSTVSSNSSIGSGGGIFAFSGPTSLTNSTVASNTSGGEGGGFFGLDAGAGPLLTIQNTIIAGNTASGAATDLRPQPTSTLDIDYSLIGDTTGSGVTSSTGTGNVLNVDPLLGPLADNGGPTFTHALLAGSPALDQGNSNVATDQRGLARPFDLPPVANAAGGDGSDIGAFEQQTEFPSLVVTTATDVVNDTDFVTSLREAINFANSQDGTDTITFDSTVFSGGLNSLIRLQSGELGVTESLTIDGSSGTNVVISGDADGNDTPVSGTFITDVDASATAGTLSDNSRVINFTPGSGNLTLTSLTVTGGRTTGNNLADSGGGIRFNGGTLKLEQGTVSGNSTTGLVPDGGGISSAGGVVSLIGSTVSGNRSGGAGGGIHAIAGTVMLTGSTVSQNRSGGQGGGIHSFVGGVSTIDSMISGNTSASRGGGIYAGGDVVLTSSMVSGNTSSRGGGISVDDGAAVNLNSSTVSGNSSTGRGGGIYARSGAVTLTSSTISGNSTPSFGGGIATRLSPVTLISSTITGNSGRVGGVSVFDTVYDPLLRIQNSIIAGNTGTDGAPDLAHDLNSTLDIDFSLIGDTTGSSITAATGTGNLLNIDPLLGPLADNGGPTFTHALLPGSPVLDAGNSTLVTDQRGLTRPIDFAAIGNPSGGNGADIGAFEQQTEFRSLIVTTAMDVVDNTDFVTSLREAINFANSQAGVDTITFDSTVFTGGLNSLIRLQSGELLVTESLTIDGSSGTDVVISGDAVGNDTPVSGTFITDVVASDTAGTLNDNTRVLNVAAGSSDLALTSLTITGGRTFGLAGGGAGIRFDGSGTLTLSASIVSGNLTTGNQSPGGGIHADSGAVAITSSTVSANRTRGFNSQGGGIRSGSGSVTVTRSTVSDNVTTGDFASGGGIATGTGAVTLTNSTVSGNNAAHSTSYGGGIFTDDATVRIQSSTLTNNNAGGIGGGISLVADNFTDDERLLVLNSIVALNTDNGTAPDLLAPGDPANDLTVDFSLIGDATGSGVTAATGTGNLLNVDPLLGPLADNGGPTLTHALLVGSPTLNAGDPSFVSPAGFDQRGTGFSRVQLGRVDMGALEIQSALPPQGLLVSTTSDVVDGNFSSGELSLREAVALANDLSGANTITFDSTVFTGGAASLIRLRGGELQITESLTIDGSSGTDVVISGDADGNDTPVSGTFITDVDASNAAGTLSDNSRVINFIAGSGDLSLNNLTITGGRAATTDFEGGGGIRFGNSALSGTLTIDQSTVSGNTSTAFGGAGGGISAGSGAVTISRSSVFGNSTTGLSADGGGIATTSSGAITLTASTVSGNSVSGRRSYGGGISTFTGALTLTGSTVTNNRSGDKGGGVFVFNTDSNPLLTIQNSIIAGNTAVGSSPDLQSDPGSMRDVDFSLIGNTTGSGITAATGTGNLLNVDPLLGPLADNGGNTFTHALLAGSPALNAGDPSFASPPDFDQRGFPRVQLGRVDIGAFEIQAILPPQGLVVSTTSDIVDGNFSAGELSLREAIAIANDLAGTDTITFDATVFTGGLNSLIRLGGTELAITESLAIDGSNGTDVVITGDALGNDTPVTGTFITDVDASLTADPTSLDDNSRVVSFTAASGDLTLTSLTITGGRTVGSGGGISALYGAIVINDSTVSGNRSGFRGGGVYTFVGSVTLMGSTVSGNTTYSSGGGIFSDGGAVALSSSTVSGNSAVSSAFSSGGGVYAYTGAVRVNDSTISGNRSGLRGGGVYTFVGSVTLMGSTVSGNTTYGSGGGIFSNGNAVSVTSSTVSGNTAGYYGGGIRTNTDLSGVTAIITNSTISGNTAGVAGGGIYNVDGLTQIFNSTITDNTAAIGGGVASFGDNGTSTEVSSSIIAGNTATTAGNDVSSQRLSDSDNSFVSLGFNLIGDGQFSGFDFFTDGTGGDIVGTTATPVVPLLGPLADNGGSTLTHALLVSSPAINTGDPSFAGPPDFDQRGVGFSRLQFDRVDIGAFELQSFRPPQGLVVSTTTDIFDGDFSAGQLSLREAIGLANDLAGADTITFDSSVFTGGLNSRIRLSGSELVITESLTIDGSAGVDVVITGDATGNDELVTGTLITDVAASLNTNSLDDNSRVINFSAAGGDLTLNQLTITGGRTQNDSEGGGGIDFKGNGTLTLNKSAVSGNSTKGASADGGGIHTRYGSLTLNESTVSGNHSGDDGGGIYGFRGAVNLTNSTVSGNHSADYGGGFFAFYGPVTLANSTVHGNNSVSGGGGIFMPNASIFFPLTIQNSIVAGNTASSTPDLRPDARSALNIDFSLIGDTTGSRVTAATGTGNLLNVDPMLGLLADNGGPTRTHALLAGSPAINAGDPSFFGPPNFDQRGAGFPRVLIGRVDIGAFEAPAVLPPQGLVVSTTSDVVDGNFSAGELSLREAIFFANDIAGTDTITFDTSVFTGGADSLIRLGGTELVITESLTIDGSTGVDVVITADALGNDTPVSGTFITDVEASLAADPTSLNDNSRVFNFSAASGNLTLNSLTITGGRTTLGSDNGAGVRMGGNGNLAINNSTVSGNSTSGFHSIGGGITSDGASIAITGSTISGNSAAFHGGGIASLQGAITLASSTVSSNSSGGDGGGIFAVSGPTSLTNSTVARNTSGLNGGGFFGFDVGDSPLLTIQNTIIAGNTAVGGRATDLRPQSTSTLDIDYSLIGDTTGSGVTAATGTGNLLNVDPLLGPLADNGGPTFTHALLAGSPALDQGTSAFAIDQRGLTRPVDLPTLANAIGGDGSDIGAFEHQTELPSLVVTTVADVVDNTDLVTSLREAIIFANSQPGADTITFDQTVFSGGSNSLIRLDGTELLITESLTIDGSNGIDVVITADVEGDDTPVSGTFITDVDASLTADPTSLDDNSRVINFSSSSGDLTLSGLTITGGRPEGSSDGGGGIRFLGVGVLTLDRSNISGNSTIGRFATGGGIFAANGAVTITSSTVSGNSTNTSTGATGGGVFAGVGAVTITSSTISGNSTGGTGGGVDASAGAVRITSSTISGNSASGNGGGVNAVQGAVTVTNSTITGNSGSDGGGIYMIRFFASPLQVQNSIIAGNTATGAGPDLQPAPGSALDIDFSLIGDTSGSGITPETGTGNRLNVDPLLGPLADNGGPTLTHAMQASSPAFNAGDPGLVGPPNFDQRGAGFSRVQIGRVDIGAFEFQAALPPQGLVVSTTSDIIDGNFSAGNLSLREAVIIANEVAGTNTITFDSSVFTGGANSLIRLNGTELVISESLTIDGSTATDVVITGDALGNDTPVSGTFITDVDASLTADPTSLDDNSRVVSFTAASGDLTLNSLTITGGRTNGLLEDGGGVRFLSTGALALGQSNLSGNSVVGPGSDGGGIYTDIGSVTLTDSIVSGNRTNNDGGGIYTDDGAVSLTRSTVSGNTANGYGGGIYSGGGAVSLTSSTVSGNAAGEHGGGIFSNGGAVSLTSSIVSGNTADGYGGGIYGEGGAISLTSSTVSGNAAGDHGGGIFTNTDLSGVTTIITNSTISGNTAVNTGGGIFNYDGLTRIVNSTITGNTAAVGGGVATYGDGFTSTEVSSSIIAGNTGTTAGNDVSSQAASELNNSFVSLGFNLIGDGQFRSIDFFTDAAGGDIVGTTAAPVDALLGPLADNGGPTFTHALLVGSPAIGAGDPNFDINGPDGVPNTDDDIRFDQRGTGFDRVFGGRIDIGAFEANDFVAPTVDIVDVSPDPRNSAVGVVTINFDEAVTGVDISDLTLTRDGVSVDISSLTLNQISPSQYTLDLSSVTSLEGNYELKVNATGSGIQDLGGNLLSTDAVDQFIIDLTGPQVESVVVNGGEAQRSMVRELTVTFSEVVSGVDANSFVLTNTTTGTQVTPTVTTQVLNGKTVATLTFTGAQFIGGSLADGNYTLTTLASVVSDAAGNQLDGNGDGTGGDNATDEFFRFYGDVDGDRDVDFLDFIAFRSTFGRSQGSLGYDAAFDADNDGDVDFFDFIEFRRNFGRSLPV